MRTASACCAQRRSSRGVRSGVRRPHPRELARVHEHVTTVVDRPAHRTSAEVGRAPGSEPAHIPCQMSAGSATASTAAAQPRGRSGNDSRGFRPQADRVIGTWRREGTAKGRVPRRRAGIQRGSVLGTGSTGGRADVCWMLVRCGSEADRRPSAASTLGAPYGSRDSPPSTRAEARDPEAPVRGDADQRSTRQSPRAVGAPAPSARRPSRCNQPLRPIGPSDGSARRTGRSSTRGRRSGDARSRLDPSADRGTGANGLRERGVTLRRDVRNQ